MSQPIRNVFGGTADALMSPHIKRRRPMSFIVVFAILFFGVGISLWAAWAGKWPVPASANFWQAWSIGGKLAAWGLSGGVLFPQFAQGVLQNISAAGLAIALACKAVVCAGISGTLAWFASKGALVPRDAYEHIRGARLYDGDDAPAMLRRTLTPGMEPFFHPDFKVSRAELGNGVLCFGSPGSGKTSIWLPQIKAALERDEFFMSLDVKKEQIQKLGPKAHFLAPWLRGSLILDIGLDITTFAQAEAFANNLVRVSASGHGKVWEAAANAVFAALVKRLVKTKPLKWTWQDLAELLAQPITEWLQILREDAPDLVKILDTAASVQSSVAFNIATDLRKLGAIAELFVEGKELGGQLFSIRRWMTENDYPIKGVVLTFDRENEGAVGFLIPFVLDYIGTMISGLPNNTKTPRTFFLDEVAQLPAPVNSLREYYEVGRSRGIMTIIACQDYAQLELLYGKQVAEVLYSNASIKVIARTTASQAQAHIAQSFGNREVSFKNISQSASAGGLNSSTASQEKTIPVILPGQLGTEIGPVGKVSDGKGGFRPSAIRALLAPMSGDIYKLDWPLIPYDEVRKAPKPLPSQHKLAMAVKEMLGRGNATLAQRIRNTQSEIRRHKFSVSDYELLELLHAFKYFDDEQKEQCRKMGFKAYTSWLEREAPLINDPPAVIDISDEEKEMLQAALDQQQRLQDEKLKERSGNQQDGPEDGQSMV